MPKKTTKSRKERLKPQPTQPMIPLCPKMAQKDIKGKNAYNGKKK